MRRRVWQNKTAGEEPVINLTPLIDVVFVILIMFIVVAPILELERVELALAKDDGEKITAKKESPIAIHVNQDNSIWLNREFVPPGELEAKLKVEKNRHQDTVPQLFHDKRAAFGTYQSIKNALEKVGFEEVDVILKPSFQS